MTLRQKAAWAFVWSAVQSWSVKLFTLLLFLVLARLLTPGEIGMAQSVVLALLFIAVLSEQGYPEAIVQRTSLESDDLNLPFAISIVIAALSSLALAVFSHDIARIVNVDGGEGLFKAAAFIPVLISCGGYQIAILKRELNFKRLALTGFVASTASGVLAVAFAWAGYGALSLVIQALIAALLTVVMLWYRPVWVPRTVIKLESFRGLSAYANNAFLSRLIDFFSGKIIDMVILAKFGVTALGVYAAGSKLYLTVLQLLGGAIIDVALSSMSKISHDRDRLRLVYLRFIFISSCTTFPLFVCIAALSPEIASILFGDKWAGVSEIMFWLSILGAVQVVQFFCGTVINAVGKSKWVMLINGSKLLLAVFSMTIVTPTTTLALVQFFVASQLSVSPLAFILAMAATGTAWSEVIIKVIPGVTAASVALAAVEVVRDLNLYTFGGAIQNGLALACVYSIAFIACIRVACYRELLAEVKYLRSGFVT